VCHAVCLRGQGGHGVAASIEILEQHDRRVVRLEAERFTIGQAPSNDVAIAADGSISRLHAALERYPAGWCVRDLGSRNGTYVNGERLWGERTLRHGDEIRVGRTRMIFRGEPLDVAAVTEAPAQAPDLTVRERDVLLSLCRPLLNGDAFSEPGTVRQIAEELVVTKAAVKQHLQRLYDKFRIDEGEPPRRLRLANEAITRGAVSLADLRDEPTT